MTAAAKKIELTKVIASNYTAVVPGYGKVSIIQIKKNEWRVLNASGFPVHTDTSLAAVVNLLAEIA